MRSLRARVMEPWLVSIHEWILLSRELLSEIEAQSYLPGSGSTPLLRLRAMNHAEIRARLGIQIRNAKICMVQNIGKTSFDP